MYMHTTHIYEFDIYTYIYRYIHKHIQKDRVVAIKPDCVGSWANLTSRWLGKMKPCHLCLFSHPKVGTIGQVKWLRR